MTSSRSKKSHLKVKTFTDQATPSETSSFVSLTAGDPIQFRLKFPKHFSQPTNQDERKTKHPDQILDPEQWYTGVFWKFIEQKSDTNLKPKKTKISDICRLLLTIDRNTKHPDKGYIVINCPLDSAYLRPISRAYLHSFFESKNRSLTFDEYSKSTPNIKTKGSRSAHNSPTHRAVSRSKMTLPRMDKKQLASWNEYEIAALIEHKIHNKLIINKFITNQVNGARFVKLASLKELQLAVNIVDTQVATKIWKMQCSSVRKQIQKVKQKMSAGSMIEFDDLYLYYLNPKKNYKKVCQKYKKQNEYLAMKRISIAAGHRGNLVRTLSMMDANSLNQHLSQSVPCLQNSVSEESHSPHKHEVGLRLGYPSSLSHSVSNVNVISSSRSPKSITAALKRSKSSNCKIKLKWNQKTSKINWKSNRKKKSLRRTKSQISVLGSNMYPEKKSNQNKKFEQRKQFLKKLGAMSKTEHGIPDNKEYDMPEYIEQFDAEHKVGRTKRVKGYGLASDVHSQNDYFYSASKGGTDRAALKSQKAQYLKKMLSMGKFSNLNRKRSSDHSGDETKEDKGTRTSRKRKNKKKNKKFRIINHTKAKSGFHNERPRLRRAKTPLPPKPKAKRSLAVNRHRKQSLSVGDLKIKITVSDGMIDGEEKLDNNNSNHNNQLDPTASASASASPSVSEDDSVDELDLSGNNSRHATGDSVIIHSDHDQETVLNEQNIESFLGDINNENIDFTDWMSK